MGKRPEGICHLCGQHCILSYEHVPPESAFNNRSVRERRLIEAMKDGPFLNRGGRQNQRGAGGHTLCERCNNNTGQWYANDFAGWCHQGMNILRLSDCNPTIIAMHYIYPLRVLKQIYTMAFSINSERWREDHPELEQFVLDKWRPWLNPRYRVFAYYNIEGMYRRVNDGMRLFRLSGGGVFQGTEMSHPPFGYVVTWNGSHPDRRLWELTHFRRYNYDDCIVAAMQLPVLPTYMPMPLDYRTRSEIKSDAARQEAVAAAMSWDDF